MTQPATIERITRSLAYMLRHQPEKFDLQLDPYGWGDVDDVLRALNEKLGEPVELEDVEEAIGSGDRPRYQIEDGRVRALYGHSIEVLPGEPSKPPEFLYVGVSSRDAERATRNGLRGGRRRFLHLARSAEEARDVGRRTAREYAVLHVFALDAWEEGINFYDRKALFLAEEVPTEFLEILDSYDDGEDPIPRGRPERAPRGRDGERGRDRERGRGRRGGRGRDRDERPARNEDRDERPARREERDERPARRENRDERPARQDRREERPAPEQPAAAPARVENDSPFGVGLDEPVAPSKPKSAPTPAPAPAREPVAPPPAPEPAASESDGDDAFGAGL